MTKLPRRQHHSPRNTDRVAAMAFSGRRPPIVRSVISVHRRLIAVMVVMTLAQATAACGGPPISFGGWGIWAPSSHSYTPPRIDAVEEAKRTRASAETGDPYGQRQLGMFYEYGIGVTQDHAEAARWYLKAAEQGDAEAQHRLGVMYYYGQGVPLDYVQADMWFILAAAGGYDGAPENRDHIETLMTPGQIAEARKLAAEWKPSTTP